MTQITSNAPVITTGAASAGATRGMWRTAGVLALLHIVLLVVGIGLQESPRFDEGVAGITPSTAGETRAQGVPAIGARLA